MSHDYTTQRSREITGSENAERLELPKPIRDFGREKKFTNRVREENEDDEVIKLQETSQRGQTEGPIISCRSDPELEQGRRIWNRTFSKLLMLVFMTSVCTLGYGSLH